MIRRVENLKTSKTSPEKDRRDQKGPRPDREAQQELAAAQEALAKLEGHPFEGLTLFATPGQAGKVSADSYRVEAENHERER